MREPLLVATFVELTDVLVDDFELFQIPSAEGPCYECVQTGEPVANAQLAEGGHGWPQFATRSVAAGFVSVSAIPMRLRGNTIGALNLFRPDTDDIEQAKGMVAERIGLTMEESFDRLRGHARQDNLRLSDLAGSVVDGTIGPNSLRSARTDPKRQSR